MVDARTWLWPSSCCRPSPLSVVRPAVAPSRKPRVRMSAAAQIRSPIRRKPGIDRVVELADVGIDLVRREERVHAEGAGLVGDDGHDPLAQLPVLEQPAE